MNKAELIAYHNLILEQLLLYKKTHPEFTFWLRKNEKLDPDKNRLQQGYWFQGNEKYMFVGLSNQSGGTNMTRSIGWVIGFTKPDIFTTHLEVVWPGEKNNAKINFYKKVIAKIGGFAKKNEFTYTKSLGDAKDVKGIGDLLTHFLNNEYTVLCDLMQKDPAAEMLIPEPVFQTLLSKVNAIKQQHAVNNNPMVFKEIEIEYPSAFSTHGQLQRDFFTLLEIPDGVQTVTVRYNNADYPNLTLGQEGAGSGRIYFPNKGATFIANNPNLVGGQKIKIQVGWQIPIVTNTNNANHTFMQTTPSLNTILYGPPGTGKTYNTIDNALQIVAPTEYAKAMAEHVSDEKAQRKAIVALFNKHLVASGPGKKIDWDSTKGKIAFCTFHQSFSYEDFIEGIKPNTDGKDISYTIQDGVFKLMCSLASKGSISSSIIDIPKNARFTKLKVPALGDLQYCIANNVVGIKQGVSSPLEAYFKNSLNTVSAKHVILVTHDNVNVNAIGLVKSDAKADTSGRFKLIRDVDWITKDCKINLASIYDADINEDIIDGLDEKAVTKVIEEQLKSKAQNANHVLIIDEINRGNVSQIFGELITLIECDKRKDTENELSVILPYSKQSFSVPKNLYLIGTMNTADRSVEALDTALRRRFDFTEMPPVYKNLEGKVVTLSGKVYKLDVILKTINERLRVLLTKDHQIGHSYFLKIDAKTSLQDVFKNNILPLLQEYFYGDFAKICMVLGKDFISEETAKEKNKTNFFAYSKHESTDDYLEKEIWNLNTSIFESSNQVAFAKAIDNLLNPSKDSE